MLECRGEPGGSSIPQGVESVATPKGNSIILSGSSALIRLGESIGSELSDCFSQIVVECSTRWFAGRGTQNCAFTSQAKAVSLTLTGYTDRVAGAVKTAGSTYVTGAG